ncbi:MAG: hypothetical protein WAP23_04280 [Candidatus Spechtbacterales bacterium]
MKIDRYAFQKIALTLGIIIVLNLLFNYAIYAFYTSPKYDDFCTAETRKYYDSEKSCEAIGGEWVAYEQGPYGPYGPYPRPVKAIAGTGEEITEPTEYCNASATCRKEYDEVHNLYNRNVFIVLVSLGAVSLIAGFFFVSVSAVSYGLLFGGLLSILIGNVRYWSGMNEYLRLVVLAVVLLSLIWIGYRKLKNK